MIREFGFGDLAKFNDGAIETAVNAALRRAAEDCDDRPAVNKPRKVVLTLEVTPVLDQDGLCEEVKFGFNMKETLPNRASKDFVMGLRKGGKITFNPDALDNHNQETFEFDGDEEG